MLRTSVLALLLALLCAGCIVQPPEPRKTALEKRQIQQRDFDTNDTKQVMRAVLAVLQDDGFIIREAEPELGILTAEKEVDVENKTEAFFITIFGRDRARWKKQSVVEASANVSSFGDATRVRVNFRIKVLDNRGLLMGLENVEDPKYYQDFFSKVDKGIFIAKEQI